MSVGYPAGVKTSTRRTALAIAVIGLCLLVAGVLWSNSRRVAEPGLTPSASASVGPRQATTSSAPAPVATTGAAPATTVEKAGDLAGCTTGDIVANHYDIPARGLSDAVVPVGQEADGAVGAPPLGQKYAMAVWTQGPKAGSGKGNVIGTAHTWTGAIGLGNVINGETGKGLQPGDVIRLTDGKKTVCYTYREKTHFMVADYREDSTIWINNEGKPQFTILTCSDFNNKTQDWDGRIVFYFDQVA